MSIDDSLPTDLASAHALIIAQREALSAAELRATAAESEAQYRALLIEKLKFTIRKLRHDRFGQSSERGALLDQLELQLADLEADAAQADTAAQMVRGGEQTMTVPSFERRRPARRPLPEHLPRERIVYPAPSSLPVLRRDDIAQDRRGRDRDAGAHSAPVEGNPACAREVLLPGLRSDQPAARSIAPDRARARGAEAARPHPILQVRPASAAQPSKRNLCSGRHRSRRVDAGRLGGRGGSDADASGRGDPRPCLRG